MRFIPEKIAELSAVQLNTKCPLKVTESFDIMYLLFTKSFNLKQEGDLMDLNLHILDTAGARPEHSTVIVNFVAAVREQFMNSTCYVFSDNVQYKWHTKDGDEKIVIPDASINCRTRVRKGNVFLDIPRFVMEVLSPSTEKYDRGEKMELYRQQEIDEYWIVDWENKKVEIYNLDYDADQKPQYYLWKIITEENKHELKIVHFPKIQITFDKLFAEVDLE